MYVCISLSIIIINSSLAQRLSSHSIDHMRGNSKLSTQCFKRLVKLVVHRGRSTDPDLANLASILRKVVLNELHIPHIATETVPTFTDANCQLEVGLTELLGNLLQGLTDVETDRGVQAGHRDVEEEDEVIFQLVHSFGDFVGIDIVLVVGTQQQMSHEVGEDEHASACTEGNVDTALLDTKSLTHRPFDVEDIEELFSFLEDTGSSKVHRLVQAFEHQCLLVQDLRHRPLDRKVLLVDVGRLEETDSLEERLLAIGVPAELLRGAGEGTLWLVGDSAIRDCQEIFRLHLLSCFLLLDCWQLLGLLDDVWICAGLSRL